MIPRNADTLTSEDIEHVRRYVESLTTALGVAERASAGKGTAKAPWLRSCREMIAEAFNALEGR